MNYQWVLLSRVSLSFAKLRARRLKYPYLLKTDIIRCSRAQYRKISPQNRTRR